MSRGRHAQPSNTSKVIARTTVGGMSVLVVSGAMIHPAAASVDQIPAQPAPIEVEQSVPVEVPEPAADETPTEEIAVVESGDTLSALSAEHGVPTWQEVYEANRDVIGENPNLIFPGQRLTMGRHADPTEEGTVVPQVELPPVPPAAVDPAPVEQAPVEQAEQLPDPMAEDSVAVAVRAAMAEVGSSYVWGAEGPSSFDCSGLVQYAFEQAGISLPRTSRAQAGAGYAVSRADLQVGDLVFYYSPISHVGIYIGNGQIVQSANDSLGVLVSRIDWAGEPTAYRRVA